MDSAPRKQKKVIKRQKSKPISGQQKKKTGKRRNKVKKVKMPTNAKGIAPTPLNPYDVRYDKGRKNNSNNGQMESTANTINIIVPEYYESYIPIATYMAMVAYKLGLGTTSNIDEVAYAAYYRVFQILNAYASNKMSEIACKVPRWIADLGMAISPKNIDTISGTYRYSWQNATGNYGPKSFTPVNIPVGYEVQMFGIPSGSTINDFPILNTTAPDPTAAEINSAFNEVCTQLEKNYPSGMWRLVDPEQCHGKFRKDASAWATRVVTQGNSNINGGAEYVAANEVNITCPLLTANITQNSQDNFSDERSTHKSCTFAGSIALFPALAGLVSEKDLFMKIPPVCAPVDLNEFVETMANFVTDVITLSINGLNALEDPQSLQCPLSLQELMLLLRDTLLRQFGECQIAGQFISHDVASDGSDRVFQPLLVGVNTCVNAANYQFILPLELVENIRCLGPIVNNVPNMRYPVIYMPVLGVYNGDTVQQSDYVVTATVNGTPVEFPAFASPVFGEFDTTGNFRKEKNGKIVTLAEVAIDPVDGGYASGYVYINDVNQLQTLAGRWNEWIAKISTCVVQPTPFTVDAGLNALRVVATTRFNAPNVVSRKKTSLASEVFGKRKVTDSPYAEYSTYAICSGGPLLAASNEFISKWILPTVYNRVGNDNVGAGKVDYPKTQTRTNEKFSMLVANTQGSSVPSRLKSYAAGMVKSPLGDNPQSIKDLQKLEEQGRGGILSMLANTFADSIFGPEVGGVIKGVADFLPI